MNATFQMGQPFPCFGYGRRTALVWQIEAAGAEPDALLGQKIIRLMAAAIDRVLMQRDGLLIELQRTAGGQPDGTQASPMVERIGPGCSGHNKITVE